MHPLLGSTLPLCFPLRLHCRRAQTNQPGTWNIVDSSPESEFLRYKITHSTYSTSKEGYGNFQAQKSPSSARCNGGGISEQHRAPREEVCLKWNFGNKTASISIFVETARATIQSSHKLSQQLQFQQPLSQSIDACDYLKEIQTRNSFQSSIYFSGFSYLSGIQNRHVISHTQASQIRWMEVLPTQSPIQPLFPVYFRYHSIRRLCQIHWPQTSDLE